MYEEYFGLERPPFKITPDTSLFYEGGKRGDILEALAYAIHRGEGIVKVVGEVGSGKTMLCRMLQLKLPDSVEIVYIANPSVSAEDILFVIAHELSLAVDKGASKHEVMHMLQDYLLQRHMEDKQVVLFIEEAQGMPLQTLEEVRLLSNLETDENKLLQIILFGQPELDQNLAQQSIRQLRERITHNFELEPLSRDEIHNYLNFRMRQVGYTGPELISSTVARKVEQHSAGLLRRINIIADKILLSAFAEGTHNLGPQHVTAAVNDSSFNQEVPRKSRLWWWLLPLTLLALALALYQTRSQWMAFASSSLLPALQVPAQTDVAVADPATTGEAVEAQDAASESLATDPAVPATGASGSADSGIAPADSVALEQSPVSPSPAVGDQDAVPADSGNETMDAAAGIEIGATGVAAEAGSGVMDAETNAGKETTDPAAVTEQTDIASLNAEVDGLISQIEQAVQKAEADAGPDNAARVDNTVATAAPAADTALSTDYGQWLDAKLEQSLQWLSTARRNNLSIQVMMRNKSAARELVYYLRNEWPLDLSQTYLYEVKIEGRIIYRVFYSEYNTMSKARAQIDALPESIKVNSPYVHSVNRMREALL